MAESTSNRPSAPAAAEPPLAPAVAGSPARLVELLKVAVAALERDARAASSAAPAREAFAASRAAIGDVERACQCPDDPDAVAAGAGRVPLPAAPSAEVDAALDALARLINAGCCADSAGGARGACTRALGLVRAVAYHAPRRVAVIVRHRGLSRAIVAALGARDDDAFRLEVALMLALPLLIQASGVPALWRARGSGARLRALAAAAAGAFGALAALSAADAARHEGEAALALSAALRACGDAEMPGLQAAMLAQTGFGEALRASIASAAAALPFPGAAAARVAEAGERGMRALVLAAAMCNDEALDAQFNGPRNSAHFNARLCQQPASPPVARRLFEAAPALVDAVVDFVAAGAPWYRAVCAALAPGGGAASGAGGAAGALVSGFVELVNLDWMWAVGVLELMAERTLRGPSDGARIGRLAPAVLCLAEAAQAVAGALPGGASAGVGAVRDSHRAGMGMLAQAAVRLVDEAVHAHRTIAPCVVAGSPGALAALWRLSVTEPPLLAAAGEGGAPAFGSAAQCLLPFHRQVRLKATHVLSKLASSDRAPHRPARPQIAAALFESPALLAAAGAAVGTTRAECFCVHCMVCEPALAAKRRALAAGLLADLAAGAAADDAGRGASWLSAGLASCRPFLAGCDDLLRRARLLRGGGGGGSGGSHSCGAAIASAGAADDDTSEAGWVQKAAGYAQDALLHVVASVGAEALAELRAAAAAGAFEEVARALEVAAAAAEAPASPAAGPEAAGRACAACGAADAPLRCGACKGARYCGPECQRRDWRAHKAACRQQQHQQQQEQQQLLR